ncbi:hypothetical protein K525DRAFT_274986 [Schizophyllum commune Loenen D]|nr:hypothetical protein K525DRAFT_274986 [Schizophyllum commune Loenen D]
MSSTSSSPHVPTTVTRLPEHIIASISGNSGGADVSDATVDMPHSEESTRSDDTSSVSAEAGEDESDATVDMPHSEESTRSDGTSSASAEAGEMVAQCAPIVVKRAQPSAAVTAMKQTKKAALEEAIQQEQQATRGRIEQIAHRFGKKKTSVQNRMFYAGVTKVQRKPNGWNTFVSFKVREYNHECPASKHLSGSAYHKKFPGVASQEWHSLPSSARREWGIKGMAAKAAKVAKLYQRRESNRSVMKDAYHTFDHLRMELIALAARTGMEMLLIGVRSEANQLQVPQHFATKKADDFLKKKVGMDVDTFASKLEIQVLAMDDDKPRNTKTSKLKNLRSEARELLHEGLTAAVTRAGRLPKSGSVSLNFPQYETKIVLPFGVELVGWPSDVPFVNPGSINRVDELDAVCRAIKSKQCVWEVLDIRQWNRRSKVIEDKVKKASKPTKTKRSKKASSVETIEESDGEEAPGANAPKTREPSEKENIGEVGGANLGSTATHKDTVLHTWGKQAHQNTGSNTAGPSPVTAGPSPVTVRSLAGSPSDAQPPSDPEFMMLPGQSMNAIPGTSVATSESLMGSGRWGQVMYGNNYMDWTSTAQGLGNGGAYFDMSLGFDNGLAFGRVEGGGTDFDMMGSNASFGMEEWSLFNVGMGAQGQTDMGGSADQSMDD